MTDLVCQKPMRLSTKAFYEKPTVISQIALMDSVVVDYPQKDVDQ